MLTRGQTKRLLRAATQERIRQERDAIARHNPRSRLWRLEEKAALAICQQVPSVFAIAEKMNDDYSRPLWADHRYGSR